MYVNDIFDDLPYLYVINKYNIRLRTKTVDKLIS